MLRRLVKTGIARALHWTGTARAIGMIDGLRDSPLVLGYHRVVDDFSASARTSMPAMLTSCRMFERQLDWIGRRYRFVSLDEIAASLQQQQTFSKPVAAVTFDDGYRDVYDYAFPLLKRKGIPAAIFVVTDLVGTAKWQIHDKLFLLLSHAFPPGCLGRRDPTRFFEGLGIHLRHGPLDLSKAVNSLLATLPQFELHCLVEALESEIGIEKDALEPHRSLTWEMVVEMHRAGITIGSHTKTHAVLINENWDKIFDEVKGSHAELERKLGTEIKHLAYPDGQFNAAAIMATTTSGYRYGYTTCRHRDPIHPFFTIPRVLLWENACLDSRGRFSPPILNCLLRGLFDFRLACDRDHALREVNMVKHESSGSAPKSAIG
jgi:peptidoglycan/xylan/chitin deacetylase (PgdA/CDA1 family)